MRSLPKLLDCLATSYRLDLDGPAYVNEIVNSAAPLLDRGLGIMAYTYDARDTSNPVIDHFAVSNHFDSKWLGPYYASMQTAGLRGPPAPTGFEAWGHMTVGQASRIPKMHRYLPHFALLGGSRDTFGVNALDASGRGLWLGALLRSTTKVEGAQITLFSRLAAHLTTAVRLRRNAKGLKPRAAAVLSPQNGALLDAEDRSVIESRDELRRATFAFDEARTKKMGGDVELATRRWRPLVESRWSLIDEFDTDGKRFVVAVENGPPTRAPKKDLSDREHQIMTQVHLGHSDKEIAYELGLSVSTVRVLLHRGMKKLGVTTRREALARFDALLKK